MARKGLIAPDLTAISRRKLGVNVAKLTPDELAAFKKAVKPVYDKWAQQIGSDLVKKAEAAVASRKK